MARESQMPPDVALYRADRSSVPASDKIAVSLIVRAMRRPPSGVCYYRIVR